MRVKEAGRYINPKETESIIASLRGKPGLQAVVELLFDTGIRIGEVESWYHQARVAKDDHFDFQPLKGNNKRSLPRMKETVVRLWESKISLNVGYLKKSIQRHCQENHLDFSPHDARHTFFTNASTGTNSVFELQAMSGHKSADVVMKYIHGASIRTNHLYKYGRDPLFYDDNYDYFKKFKELEKENASLRGQLRKLQERGKGNE